MARRKKTEAFDIDLSDEARETLASELCDEVMYALAARSAMIAEGGLIDLFDWFYEQGRTDARDLPFPGAADLTSWFITETVDALGARLMKAVFGVKPFCFAEGWGLSASNAAYVEAFMDWKASPQESTLKADLGKVVHGALIEDAYVLEVSDQIETRRITEQVDVALELDPASGAPLFADGKPKLRMDPQGEPVPAQDGEASAKVERTHTKTKRLGPQYTPISMKDFAFLPGHARNSAAVWGYCTRCWARLPELQEKVTDGIYDQDAVEAMGEQSDRYGQAPTPTQEVAPQQGPSVEKELFQISLKRDLDEDGREEWYVATVSVQHRQLLRLKLDTFVMKVGHPRCVPFVLFPRRNSVYGYSLVGDKMLTLAEEHTAVRNMKADRGALVTNAPMKVRLNALWDPDVQPFGVGRTITVRDMDEVQPLQIPDVPTSMIEQEQGLIGAKERVSGLSDVAVIGTQARQSNTLGQDQMISRASAVRVDEPLGHLHAAISMVMQLSHAIWVETLEADPQGVDAPAGVIQGLAGQGLELQNGKFTAVQLKGDFHFEPYGSDDTADPAQRQAQFNNKFIALANLAKVLPGVQLIFQNPEATKAIVEEWCRAYNVRDRQPYLGALAAPPIPPGMGTGLGPPPMGMPSGAMPPGMPPPGMPPPSGDPMAQLMAMLQGGASGPH